MEYIIPAIGYIIINILNTITKHYTEYKGLVRVLLFLVEIVSMLTSKNTLAMFKWPGTYKSILWIPLSILIASCASWQTTSTKILDGLKTSVVMTSDIVINHYDRACGQVASVCKAKQDMKCPQLIACHESMHRDQKRLDRALYLISMGYTAIALGDRASMLASSGEVQKLLKEIHID